MLHGVGEGIPTKGKFDYPTSPPLDMALEKMLPRPKIKIRTYNSLLISSQSFFFFFFFAHLRLIEINQDTYTILWLKNPPYSSFNAWGMSQ